MHVALALHQCMYKASCAYFAYRPEVSMYLGNLACEVMVHNARKVMVPMK